MHIKKALLLFFILAAVININSIESAYNFEDKENIFFYIPEQDDLNNYFNLYNYLNDWDNDKIDLEDDHLIKIYENFIYQKTLQGLLFEAFLRQTKNKKIQNQILNTIDKKKYQDEFSQILVRLYNSEEKKFMQDNHEQIQYNYKDQYFDENINLFKMNEIMTYNKELGLMLFENEWAQISYKDKENNKTDDSFFLLYGGGTNSMTINFNRYDNITFRKFYNEKVKDKFHSKKYKDWKIEEIPIKGVLERAGADKIYIGIGIGPDIIPEIDTGTFSIFLYNNKSKKGYSIVYFMNFSKINNNYKMRYRILNHLLMQLTLTFIK